MKLKVKGEIKEYKEGLTPSELIEIEGVETPEYVTVSINDELIGYKEFQRRELKEGDELEFLYFMGGGAL